MPWTIGWSAVVPLVLLVSPIAAIPARAAPMTACVPGAHVVDEYGTGATIDSDDQGFCSLTFDDGTTGYRMYYTLQSTDGGATPGAITTLPDGTYDCSVATGTFKNPGIMAMGDMDISSGTYRFRPFGNVTDGYAAYAIEASGDIDWYGHMGGLDQSPSVIQHSWVTGDGRFNVQYLTDAGGLSDVMSCRLM